MVLLATSAYGFLYGMELQQSFEELYNVKRLLLFLRQELHYYSAPLGEAFEHIGNLMKEPYRSWLLGLSGEMEKRETGSFVTLWEESIQYYLKESRLSNKEKEHLLELGMYFGGLDKEAQLNAIGLHIERMELEIQQQKETLSTRKRLGKCMGVMSGLFITVLLM